MISDPKTVVTQTVSELEHFLAVLFEVLIPVIFIVLGLVVGPQIFNGGAIANAIYSNGLTGTIGTGTLPYSFVIGHLAGAGIIGTAAGAMWKYQEGKSGIASWIARSTAGFTIGWALGILFQLIAQAILNTNPVGLAGDGAIDRWIFTWASSAGASVQKSTS